MAKASKPVALQSAHLTQEQIEKRKQAEERLKGNSNLVYTPPKQLSKEEKKIYKFIVKELESSNILNNLDITILETTVDAIYRMKECKDNIDKYGVVTFKEDGSMQRNPATIIYKDYNAIFNKCCMELGLSPSARAKLSVLNVNSKEEKEDELLKILGGDKNG